MRQNGAALRFELYGQGIEGPSIRVLGRETYNSQ